VSSPNANDHLHDPTLDRAELARCHGAAPTARRGSSGEAKLWLISVSTMSKLGTCLVVLSIQSFLTVNCFTHTKSQRASRRKSLTNRRSQSQVSLHIHALLDEKMAISKRNKLEKLATDNAYLSILISGSHNTVHAFSLLQARCSMITSLVEHCRPANPISPKTNI